VADGWSREDAPFTLVTDGVESAVAGIVQECLNVSVLDEIVVSRVPVLGGTGHSSRDSWPTAARGYARIVAVWDCGEWLIGGVALQT
jgi:hypothetical protein